MGLSLSNYIFLGIAVLAAAFHSVRDHRAGNSSSEPYKIAKSPNDPARAKAIEIKQQNFLYGPSPVGQVPFFPAGSLGNATVLRDITDDLGAFSAQAQTVVLDQAAAAASITQAGGFKTLPDYALLYNNQWKQSVPEGLDPGMLSNYTNDLLFSMERLSVNPYSVRRLHPTQDSLPFAVDNTVVRYITGVTLESLHALGSLFYADHRSQMRLQKTIRYAPACDAYFYIHPNTCDFLPLAIRPNGGSDLTYTPQDTPDDWLLAKMMFNLNDLWYGQMYHFAATHEVVEIVYEAAIRTLSDGHPVLAILNRVAFRAFAYRPLEATRLLNPGGPLDTLFPYPGSAAAQYQAELYTSGGAGAFQSNYFYANLKSRGLYKSEFGPRIKHFPFLEDAAAIHSELEEFMTTFVQSYYHSGNDITMDVELQAWITEAIPAQIIDFPPPPLTKRSTLIDMLTHLAFLATVVHHTLNTNDPVTSTAMLPFHPASLYSPVPTSKGVIDLLPFLPPPEQSIAQVALLAFFNRQRFAGTNLTLSHLLDDPAMLYRMNDATQDAARRFQNAMGKLSGKVGNRTFDEDGLSQGMPFVWKALDPEVVPFYLAT